MSDWKIRIDTGGTFTDCLAEDPDGAIHRLKILSNSTLRGRLVARVDRFTWLVDMVWPVIEDIYQGFLFRPSGQANIRVKAVNISRNHITLSHALPQSRAGESFDLTTDEEVPVLAARLLTRTRLTGSFPKLEMRLGSTRGTNAILERKGARTAFVTTRGFRDLLIIGDQQRPDLFALDVRKPTPLYALALEVNERVNARGEVLQELTTSEQQRVLKLLRKHRIESVAVALLNSYQNNTHEIMLRDFLVTHGYAFVSISSELSRQIKLLWRAETTVVNAYLQPIIHHYVSRIRQGLHHAPLRIMTSAGSLAEAGAFQPKDSLLSGPAGGVVGAVEIGKQAGHHEVIGIDMGGTSTDVSLYHKRLDYRYESKVGDQKILSPSLAIETIAAGGGSICDFDGHKFTVGPHSAGASPGPACYGQGGPLTITDVNLLLGRVNENQFALPLSPTAAARALQQLMAKARKQTKRAYRELDVLLALVTIANEKMAEAIKKVSLQRGYDPRHFALVSFGGAGGQHACSLAEHLGMKNILVPYDAGLLSAFGIACARLERTEEQLVLQDYVQVALRIEPLLNELAQRARNHLIAQGETADELIVKERLIFLRFRGQETPLEIVVQPNLPAAYEKRYRQVYGHWLPDREIEVVSVHVRVTVREANRSNQPHRKKTYSPDPAHQKKIFSRGRWLNTPVFEWERLRAGARINGPALISSNNSTTWVEDGWRFELDGKMTGHLSAKRLQQKNTRKLVAEADLELYTNRFTAIAEEMGALLQRTSFSVNVKERLDFSCALLDAQGFLVVNAPHIPVHLGSLGVCVREVKKALKMKPGDVVLTNHPGFGGSHLPDVTLIKPVYHDSRLIGYVANRAHHAEIGGAKPGSMPAFGKSLDEEGVIISPIWLMRNGKVEWARVKKMFTDGRYPSRLPEENLADLNGALAALQYGEQALHQLCKQEGAARVRGFMKQLRLHARESLREALHQLPRSRYQAVEYLDDGSPLCVQIRKHNDRISIDFAGTAARHAGNLNATPAIVQSVVLYVMRLLVNQPIPMNEGLMDLIDLHIPSSLLNPDFHSQPIPAVVGGNTEVSQRLTDLLLKALDLSACSQGTMNNFLFGNARLGYYETIAGGCGAGPGFTGASAVHQHMTNTRITDAEILEHRYPVEVMEFSVRKGSGGKGRWHGGNGLTRVIRFGETMEVNILTQHRKEKPFGKRGGAAGAPGQQEIIRTDGTRQKLKGLDSAEVRNGDMIKIKTPGGGGWGR